MSSMKTQTRVLAVAACVLAVVGIACSDSAKSEFAKAKTANSEQAYRQFLKAHPDHALAPEAKRALENVVLDAALRAGGAKALETFIAEFPDSQRLAEAKAKLDLLVQERIYHWKPKGMFSDEGARDVQVMETKDHGIEITGTSESSHVPATMDFSGGGVRYFVEGLGSRNVKVKVNKELGFTTYVGLKFKADVTLNVRKDGTIEVDREGVEALEGKDRLMISRQVTLNGKPAIVMIEQF